MKGILLVLVLVLVLALLLPSPALAWAPEGHEVVAEIAELHLTPAARAQVANLLGGDTMILLNADWADEIRAGRPETSPWHYVDIELDESGYDARRDCPGGDCVVAQIERDTRILANRAAPRPARIEALRFLIHFVGDIHQPLHCADNHDKGGNADIVYLHGERSNLHRVWDDDVVSALGDDAVQVGRRIDASLSAKQKADDSGGTPEQWADESFAAAKTIYAGVRREDLPDDYARRQGPLVRDRLAKAGLRLAALLNGISE